MRGKEGEREGGTWRGERGRDKKRKTTLSSLFQLPLPTSRFHLSLPSLASCCCCSLFFSPLLNSSSLPTKKWRTLGHPPPLSKRPPRPPGAYQPDGNIWPFQALRLPWAGTWGTDRYSLIQLGVNGLGAQSAQQGAETVFVGLEAEVAAAEGRGTLGGGGCLRERERGKERERWRGRRNEFKTSSPFHLALSVNYNDNKQPSPTTACSSTAT